MIMFFRKGNEESVLRDPKKPKWVKCLLACIPSIILIVLGVWSIFSGDKWELKALGGFLVLIAILFAAYVCLTISVDEENKNDTQDK